MENSTFKDFHAGSSVMGVNSASIALKLICSRFIRKFISDDARDEIKTNFVFFVFFSIKVFINELILGIFFCLSLRTSSQMSINKQKRLNKKMLTLYSKK